MQKTIVKVSKMDCPSEVKMIESLFEGFGDEVKADFDLNSREVTFYHEIENEIILNSLESIALPGKIVSSDKIAESDVPSVGPSVEAKTLKILLLINFTMFIVEVGLGIYAESSGLLADGLDMLADSLVYGVSLYAVGKALTVKSKAAFMSGIMQISLGLLCLMEVIRKFIFGSEPISGLMISIASVALMANIACLLLIHKHKDGEVHMKASWIFSANDVIVNLGVILSGVFVYFLNSNIPDLLIGAIVSIVVLKGGATIIKISKAKPEQKKSCCNSSCN